MQCRFVRCRNQVWQPLHYSSTTHSELVLAGHIICKVNSDSGVILNITILPSCHHLHCSIRLRRALTTKERLTSFTSCNSKNLKVQNYHWSSSLISTVLQECSRNQAVKTKNTQTGLLFQLFTASGRSEHNQITTLPSYLGIDIEVIKW